MPFSASSRNPSTRFVILSLSSSRKAVTIHSLSIIFLSHTLKYGHGDPVKDLGWSAVKFRQNLVQLYVVGSASPRRARCYGRVDTPLRNNAHIERCDLKNRWAGFPGGPITGDHSKYDQILLVKIAKYIDFCVYRGPYLI